VDAQKNFTIDLFKAIMDKNECMAKVVPDAYKIVPELDILKGRPVNVKIRKLIAGMR